MNPTLLIGLDGATFTILDPLIRNGVMPFLASFLERGVRAELHSTPNPLTPPAWIALMTGRNPGTHGVFDFIWSEERGSEVYFTLYNFRDIQCETIWSMVSRQQGRVGTLNFPMMSPPPEVNGYVIPGLVSWKHLRRNIFPRQVFEELKQLPGFSAREMAWDFDMEKEAAKGVPEEEYENWIRFHIRRERQWFAAVRHLMRTRPADLTAILFDGPDKMLHMGWRFLDPDLFPAQPTSWEARIRTLLHEYFRELDTFLAEIEVLAGPEARIFMASDHGFGPSREVLRINTWLAEQGYLTWRQVEDLAEDDRERYRRLIDRHFVLLDWDRTTAYASTTTSNGIHIRVARSEGGSGVPVAEYETFRQELIDKLYRITDHEGRPVISRVMTREEAFPGPNNLRAPDLTIATRDHGFLSIVNREPVLYRRPKVEGTHYPVGVFMAAGPGISRGGSLGAMQLVDIAPCLLHSLGLPVPSDLEGRVVEGLFRKEYLEENPVRQGRPTVRPDSYALLDHHTLEADEEAQIIKQLQALGYME
ncbi:alkaline phosphatase family protein [Thermodesulfobacteriota bacterium B35]